MQTVASRHNSYFQGLSNGTDTAHMSRIRHQCAKPCTAVKLVYANYYWNGSNADTNGPNSITVKASVEYPAGTFFPVTFNSGSATATLAAGDILVSDPISGLSVAAAGDFLYSRTYVTVTSGQKWPLGLVTLNSTKGEGVELNGSDKTASGTVTASTSFCYSPAAVVGTPTSAISAIAIVGDSIGLGSNDTSSPTAFEDRGMFWRSFGSAATYVYVNACKSGDTAALWTATNAAAKRVQILQYCTHAICEMGINDLSNGSATLLGMQTLLTAMWTALAAVGLKVYQTTITPRTTSSDSWATTANQTVYTTPATFGTIRTQLNDWIRGLPSPLTGYIEIADSGESARNSNKWAVTGAANYATSDGLHPSAAIHTLMGAAISVPALESIDAPANVVATAASSTQVNLSYNAVSDNVDWTVTLQYDTHSNFSSPTTVASLVRNTVINVTGLTPATLYYFRLKVVDGATSVVSPWSSSASATTQSAGSVSIGGPGPSGGYRLLDGMMGE